MNGVLVSFVLSRPRGTGVYWEFSRVSVKRKPFDKHIVTWYCLLRILLSYGLRRKITFESSVFFKPAVCSCLYCLSSVTVHKFEWNYQFSRFQHISILWPQPYMYVQNNCACQSMGSSWNNKAVHLGNHAGLSGGFFGNTCRVSLKAWCSESKSTFRYNYDLSFVQCICFAFYVKSRRNCGSELR